MGGFTATRIRFSDALNLLKRRIRLGMSKEYFTSSLLLDLGSVLCELMTDVVQNYELFFNQIGNEMILVCYQN